MSDSFKITVRVPLLREEVQLSRDVIFMNEDGFHFLPAGKRIALPMLSWEKLSVEMATDFKGE